MKIRALIGLLLVFVLTACQTSPPAPDRLAVTVARAVSGNTVELTTPDGVSQRVRLVGIDAPILSHKPWGPAARDRLEEIVKEADRKFQLELDNKSATAPDNYKYGYLWRGDVLINEQLIQEGQGLAITKYSKYEQRLIQAQYYARMMTVGIWSHISPMRENPRPQSD
jgi:micrococcal nuclease